LMNMNLSRIKDTLITAGVLFEDGLSAAEVETIQSRLCLILPPDLKDLLTFALPVSHGFINWRAISDEELNKYITAPLEGILFDIECNSFWIEEWGSHPESKESAFEIASAAVNAAPKLVPLRGHRYIPSEPHESGNPIFSVHQTDIIYYGCNLEEWFENEFTYYFRGPGANYRITEPTRNILFWSQLVELNNG